MEVAVERIRSFVAILLNDEVRAAIAAEITRLRPLGPRVGWVVPPNLHLTLKFLGNIDPDLVDRVLEAMRQPAQSIAPFQLQLLELGVFPNSKRPRVLWAGVEGDLALLKDLQKKVDEAVSALGFAQERQPFHPHLTLGRVREGVTPAIRSQIGATLSAAVLKAGDLWLVDAVHLIRSTLTPGGALYTSLGSVPLWKE